MLLKPPRQIVCHADIERPVPAARKDVNVIGHPTLRWWLWVPAFAGTTPPPTPPPWGARPIPAAPGRPAGSRRDSPDRTQPRARFSTSARTFVQKPFVHA